MGVSENRQVQQTVGRNAKATDGLRLVTRAGNTEVAGQASSTFVILGAPARKDKDRTSRSEEVLALGPEVIVEGECAQRPGP